jgi:anti-anti-sigma factor
VKINSQPHGNVSVVVAHGPLIAEELIDLRRAVQTAAAVGPGAPGRHVVVDMSDVPYLDSSGIELLIELSGLQNATHPGAPGPKLAALSSTCLEALELTDVLPRLQVYDTVDNALRSCRR